MKYLFVAAAALTIGAPANAQTYYSYADLPLLMKASKTQTGIETIIQQKESVDSTLGVSPRSVKLASDVTFGAAGNSVRFEADQILFGRYANTVWTYCGISNMTAASAGLNMLFLNIPDKQIACLHDSDSDGVFDSGWSGGDAINSTNMTAFSLSGPRSLSSDPAYEKVDPELGPGMPVELVWKKSRNSSVISFSLEISGKPTAAKNAPIPAKGGPPTTVSIAGAEYLLHGYDAKEKSISVSVVKPLPRRFTTLKATRVTTMRTTYVPVYY